MEKMQKYSKKPHKTVAKSRLRWNEHSINTFTIISAHLSYFIPGLSYRGQHKVFKKYIRHAEMNSHDLEAYAKDDTGHIKGWDVFLSQIAKRPGMICTFHFGPYQLINYLLVKAKVPFALLVSDRVMATWRQRNSSLLPLIDAAQKADRFRLLNANKRDALKMMYQLAKQGYCLLVYADGLEGLDTESRGMLEKLPFLAADIEVSRGIATLAHSLKLPVYPMLALRKRKNLHIRTWPTVYPHQSEHRRDFAQRLMAHLYAGLATYVLRWPEQWTNWPFLESIRIDLNRKDRATPKIPKGKCENPKKYGIMHDEDKGYLLLRKNDLQCFSISPEYYNSLRRRWYPSEAIIR